MSDTSFEEGEKSGIEKRERIGIEKGELAKALKIAKGMLDKGGDLKTISELTGLSEAEIKNLPNEKLNAD